MPNLENKECVNGLHSNFLEPNISHNLSIWLNTKIPHRSPYFLSPPWAPSSPWAWGPGWQTECHDHRCHVVVCMPPPLSYGSENIPSEVWKYKERILITLYNMSGIYCSVVHPFYLALDEWWVLHRSYLPKSKVSRPILASDTYGAGSIEFIWGGWISAITQLGLLPKMATHLKWWVSNS